jgi:hypothetical protein
MLRSQTANAAKGRGVTWVRDESAGSIHKLGHEGRK